MRRKGENKTAENIDFDKIQIKIDVVDGNAKQSIGKVISGLKQISKAADNSTKDGLSNLRKTLNAIKNFKMNSTVVENIKSISEAINSIDGAKASDLAKIAQGLKEVAKKASTAQKAIGEVADVENIVDSGFVEVANHVEEATAAMREFGREASKSGEYSIPNWNAWADKNNVPRYRANDYMPNFTMHDMDAQLATYKPEPVETPIRFTVPDGQMPMDMSNFNVTAWVNEATAKIREFQRNAGKSIRGVYLETKSVVKDLLGFVAPTLKKIGSSFMNHLISPIKNLGKSFKHTNGFVNKFLKSIGRIALYRMIRSILKSITQGMTEGIKNVYAWSKANDSVLKSSFDSIATSALYVKNSFGAMATPLINYVAPLIEKFANMVVDILNYINQAIAIFTGASTWTRAIRYSTEFGNNAERAAGAARDYKNTITGIDEINPLNGTNDGGSGGGGGGTNADGMFTTEPVSQANSWIADLIEAVNNGDWFTVGQTLGTRVGEAIGAARNFITSQNWQGVGEAIATTCNGFFEGYSLQQENGNGLGSLLGDAINSAVGLASGFIGTLDWSSVGTTIGTDLENFFSTVDWASLGMTFSGMATGFLDLITNGIEAVDWTKVGESIGTFLGNLDLGDIVIKLAKLTFSIAKGIIKFAAGAVSGFVKAIAHKIDPSIPDEDLTFATSVKLIIETISVTIKTEFEDIWDAIKYWWANLWNTDNKKELGEKTVDSKIGVTFVTKWTAIWTAIKTWWTNLWGNRTDDEKTLPTEVVKAKHKFQTKTTWDDVWTSIKTWWKNLWKNNNQTELDNTTITMTANINGTSSANVNSFKKTWDSIKTKTVELTAKAKNATASVLQTLKSSWNTVKDKTSTLTANAKQNAVAVFNNLKSSWNTVKTRTSTLTANAKQQTTAVFNNLKTTWNNVKDRIATLTGKAVNSSPTVLTTLKNSWDAIKSKTVTLTANIQASVSDLKTWINNHIITPLNSKINAVRIFGQNPIPLLANGGFVNSGQMFIAREAGAEMVGSIGNHTAVANNDQIVEGIASGVASANQAEVNALNQLIKIASALLEKDSSAVITTSQMTNAFDRQNRRTGKTVVPVG